MRPLQLYRSAIIVTVFTCFCYASLAIRAQEASSSENTSEEAPPDPISLDKIKLAPGQVPIGAVLPFAAPYEENQRGKFRIWLEANGWMFCDGRPLSIKEAPLLHAVIGNAHGSGYKNDGSEKPEPGKDFNIPDYRGRFLRGIDTSNQSRDPDIDGRVVMNIGGNREFAVGSVQSSATKRPNKNFATGNTGKHDHGGDTGEEGEHRHLVYIDNGKPAGDNSKRPIARSKNRKYDRNKQNDTDLEKDHSHSISKDGSSHSHAITAGGDNETRPKNAYVEWIIRFK